MEVPAYAPRDVARWLVEALPTAALLHEGETILAVNPGAIALLGSAPKQAALPPALARLRPPEAAPGDVTESSWRAGNGEEQAVRHIALGGDVGVFTFASGSQEPEVERLREMNHFKTQLLNTAAHELNTPLTPVRLQLHMLVTGQFGPLEEAQKRAVSVLERNIRRLSSLTSDILDVARLDSGNLRLSVSDIALGPLLEDAADAFGDTAANVGVELVVESADNLGVHADPQRTTQVLYNLIGNAIKFTPEGGSVHVRAQRRGTDVTISVTDTGVGLEADQIELLFLPFSQVQEDSIQAGTGTGLGLYICKGLAEAQGGRIEVVSDGRNKGSTFRVHLPWASEFHAAATKKRGETKSRGSALQSRLRELI